MRYTLLLTFVTLATFGAASTAAAACVAFCWTRIAPALAGFAPSARARLLFLLRIAPAVAGLVAGSVAIRAFMRYEPLSTTEVPGLLLVSTTVFGAALLVIGLWRLVTGCWKTVRFVWMMERTGTPIALAGVTLPTFQLETSFPLVAVAGLIRPRLLIARRVLEQLPSDELQVVVRHELAHATRRDNVIRLLVSGMPDVLSWAGRWIRLERAWCEAAEEAADDLATDHKQDARLCLASALVRTAKMAERHSAPRVPLLAFHDGESVERRVRRLVAGTSPAADTASPLRRLAVVAILITALPLLTPPSAALLPAMHRAIEWLVNARL